MTTSTIPSRIFLCVLFGLCGFLANWYKVGLFFNVDFLFGSVFSILAILVLGRTCGILSAFIAGTCTYLLWNHPWAIVIFTSEAVVVSWLYAKRKGNLVFYDLIYWMCFGIPMVFLFYHYVMGVTVQASLVVMLKQFVNGLSNTLLAVLAFVLFKFVKKPAGLRISYSELLFVVMVAFALLPTLLLSISATRTYEKNGMETLQSKVSSITQIAQKNLAGWVNEHHNNVQTLAKLVGDPNTRSFEEIQHYVETVDAASPAFKGMGVFDNRSISVSYSPLEQDGKSNLGVDMSSRPHIAVMRKDKQPYVTDMLISKLGDPTPIVILLAPIIISGEYKGYCSGVVETSQLSGFLTNLKTQNINITLVDGQNRVIVSTLPDSMNMVSFARPYLPAHGKTAGYQPMLWQPEASPNISLIQRWQSSFLYSSVSVSGNCHWRLIVEASLLPFTEDISRYSLSLLTLQGVLIFASILLSFLLSNGFIANVKKLQMLTRSVPLRIDDSGTIEWPNSAVEELAELSTNFQQMTSALTNHIAEQNNTEGALRESQAKLEAALASIVDAVVISDSLGQFIHFNEAFATFHRFRSKEECLRTIAEYPDILDVFMDTGNPAPLEMWAVPRALQGETITNAVYSHRRKDTGETWIGSYSFAPIRDNDGVIVGSVAVGRDITESRRQEEDLRLSEQHRSLALEAAQAGTWEWDLLTNEHVWSNELWGLYGLEPYSCQPSHEEWRKTIHPDDLSKTEKIIQEAVDQGFPFSAEWRVTHSDGAERWLMSRGKPLQNNNDRVVRYLGIVFDNTKQKKTEEEKKNLQAQLTQAQKMEAIGTLAGGIAHDFNNILGAILGYTEMAKDACPIGSDIARDLEKVLASGERAADLVKQILAFSRQSNIDRFPVEPVHLVKETIKFLRPALPATIEIKQNLAATTCNILADPTQVHQVVMNLCTNAFHAMEDTGGVLEITLNDCVLSPQDLQHQPTVQPGNFVELLIKDTGPGMPKKIQDRVFEPYFTTKEVGKGTGLGLSIVHGIVTSLGGFVTCESESGKGTAFHVFIPAIEAEAISANKLNDLELTGKERILLVDDEEILVEMGKAMLERLGYHVTTRSNSLDALATFQNQPQGFDAVVTDQTMPVMTGVDLARRMLQIRPDIPIILCTGYSSIINEEQVYRYGIKGFIMKPLSKKELASALRRVLESR